MSEMILTGHNRTPIPQEPGNFSTAFSIGLSLNLPQYRKSLKNSDTQKISVIWVP